MTALVLQETSDEIAAFAILGRYPIAEVVRPWLNDRGDEDGFRDGLRETLGSAKLSSRFPST